MIALIKGGSKSGKSDKAQELAAGLSHGENLYYVATMIPVDLEDDERIQKHIQSRDGMGFVTVELPRDIGSLCEYFKPADNKKISSQTFLVDSLTALLSNEMFVRKEAVSGTEWSVNKDATDMIIAELEELFEIIDNPSNKALVNLIFVSDSIYSDAVIYDEATQLFQRGLARIEQMVAAHADKVIEMHAGIEKTVLADDSISSHDLNMVFIFGGAYQGKLKYAIENFGLSDEDIYTFDSETDCEIPAGYRAYNHVERYVRALVIAGRDFSDEDVLKSFNNAIVIMDDITCGVVPVDDIDRKWRQEAGKLMQRLASDRAVIMVSCGIGQKL